MQYNNNYECILIEWISILLYSLTQVYGGSGSFQWSCDHVDVVGVSTVGVATAVGPGKATITASDIKNSAHYDTAEVLYVYTCIRPVGVRIFLCMFGYLNAYMQAMILLVHFLSPLSLSSQVYVVLPSTMVFLPSRVEAVVGGGMLLPLMVKGYTTETTPRLLPFYDCRQLNLKLVLSDKAIFNVTLEKNIGQNTHAHSLPLILSPFLSP